MMDENFRGSTKKESKDFTEMGKYAPVGDE